MESIYSKKRQRFRRHDTCTHIPTYMSVTSAQRKHATHGIVSYRTTFCSTHYAFSLLSAIFSASL